VSLLVVGLNHRTVPLELPATADDPAAFAWYTDPPPPGLSTRTGDASLLAPNCAASEAATASCSVEACCPSTWIWRPLPASDCEPFCLVAAPFSAAADERASFACDVVPSSPELPTLVGEAVLPELPPQPHGERSPNCWTASDPAKPAWPVSERCPSTWMPVPPQPHVPAAAFWLAFCEVPARLPAIAPESAAFVCETEPSFPSLPTRTGEASFDAPRCQAADAASAP